MTVADPGFPQGGGANSPGGRQHTILPNFPKNCMKLKEFGPRGGRPKFYYVDPPLYEINNNWGRCKLTVKYIFLLWFPTDNFLTSSIH